MRRVSNAAVIAFVASAMVPAFPRDKKPVGQIPDRRKVLEVESYCINKSGLSEPDRLVVNNFLKAESAPRHLLTKLPWKLMEDCRDGDPDAVATLEFVRMKQTYIGVAQPTPFPVAVTPSSDPFAPIKVVLTVGDASSQKLLYRTQAMPLTNTVAEPPAGAQPDAPVGPVEKRDAVYHVFWSLIQDLERLHGLSSK